MTNKGSSLKKIAYVCLYASNLSESVKFYRDILGLKPTYPEADINTTNFFSFKTGTTI